MVTTVKVNVDCRNMNCPMPIVKTARAIKNIAVGETLEIIATDAAFEPDIRAWARKTGHQIERLYKENDCSVAVIRKTK